MLAVGEEVEGVEVAVADHACGGRASGEQACGGGEVAASDRGGLVGDALNEGADVAAVVVVIEVVAVGRSVVEAGGSFGEGVGEAAGEGVCVADRAGGAESGEERVAGCVVHQGPGAIESGARAAGCADGWDGRT